MHRIILTGAANQDMLDDAVAAEELFSILMGEDAEASRGVEQPSTLGPATGPS